MEVPTSWEEFQSFFDGGDPEIRTWFLVRHNVSPFVLCGLYIVFVKWLGPVFMKNRKPFKLRKVMIAYNLIIVSIYMFSVSRILTYGWYVYILKYVEFFDTVFFIMRKRYDLVTNLHVIHHGILPILAWIILRTETSGYQGLPALINSFVHIFMYGYYALAAMGPSVRKYLWWKRYLTMFQMAQFVLVLILQGVVVILGGCGLNKTSFYLNTFGAAFFLSLFCNFYTQSFKRKEIQEK